ncbi:MAG: A/G-specific adenine glycosylase [Ignavibacteria bacterium]|nr:A/G-specific adenine glycosylase [Ignavibacteria bacterium]
MLQQTQADRVALKYAAWLRAFPTVRALARATTRDVLLAWAGLGYNRRALHLHAAALRIVEAHSGRVPSHGEALRALPGIGRYSAAAVAVFAFEKREPVVDVNIRRILSRISEPRTSSGDVVAEADAWALAERMLPPRAYRDWNQALMDLGALFCTARAPRCAACPLHRCCASAFSIEPGTARKPPSPAPIPRRIHRGRVIAFLRAQPGHRATLRGVSLALPGTPAASDHAWLMDVLVSLQKDGLIEAWSGRKRITLPVGAQARVRIALPG